MHRINAISVMMWANIVGKRVYQGLESQK